jgi:DNA primase
MRFPDSFLEEIKARLPVSEVVGRRVKLTRAGREFKGLSPFNQEKTPSFTINDQKGFYHDFSSGKHGNIFDFLMETEGLSFPEAVERLAAEAGLALPTETPEAAEREKKRASLQDVLELATQYFEGMLQGRAGARARGYLADRGMVPAVQREFRLGYAGPERFGLRDHLAGRGVDREMMIAAGLLVHGEDIAVPYDSFRERVIFPIADRAGRIIAFGGRALDNLVQPKYKNSPETALFHKGSVLYNHHNARKSAHAKGTVIAVEGYVDVIAMTAAGFPHVVAPLGTALTADQCDVLWKMAEEPILCFDGDKAGRKAAFRAIDTALPLIGPGRTLRFAFLPEGQDPDDLARSEGPAAIADVLAAARPLVDVLWSREAEAQPLDTPERRAALERRLAEISRTITDETLRRYYGEELRARLRGLRAATGDAQNQERRGARRSAAGERGAFRPAFPRERVRVGVAGDPPPASASLLKSALFRQTRNDLPLREVEILLMIVNHPGLFERYAEDLASLDFVNSDLAKLQRAILDLAVEEAAEMPRSALERAGLGPLLAQIEAKVGYATYVKPQAVEAVAEASLRQALALHRRARALHKDRKLAEIACGADPTEGNFAHLSNIRAELTALEGREAVIEELDALSGRQNQTL